jgi:peroxiredoxin family protein
MISNKMMKQNIAVILFSSFAFSACAKSTNNTQQIETPTTNQNLSSEQQKKLQQLLDKTKKNLVEIKGGTFMMGDFGEQKSPDNYPTIVTQIVSLYTKLL